jgi:hypothetical protein
MEVRADLIGRRCVIGWVFIIGEPSAGAVGPPADIMAAAGRGGKPRRRFMPHGARMHPGLRPRWPAE